MKYILPIFVYLYFFYVSLSLENHLIASHQFFTDVLSITERAIPLKKPHHNISLSAVSNLRYFVARFWVCFSILQSCSTSFVMKFYTDVFYVTLTVNELRKIPQLVSAGDIMRYIWVYSGYIPQCLENLKTYPYYFTRMCWCYWGGQQTKKRVGSTPVFDIFGCFCPFCTTFLKW